MENSKVVDIIKNSQKEQCRKYVEGKVNEIMNSKVLEKVINFDVVYANLTDRVIQILSRSSNDIIYNFEVGLPSFYTLTIKGSTDGYACDDRGEIIVANDTILDSLNSLLTLDNVGQYINEEYIISIYDNSIKLINNEDVMFTFSRKNINEYTLTISNYDNQKVLNSYYNKKRIFFSEFYYKYCRDLCIVGLDKNKVDALYKSEMECETNNKETETTSNTDDKPKKKHWWE